MIDMTESSSAFIVPAEFSAEWRDITLAHRHTHTVVYTATRYGRRFLLKALAPEDVNLTEFRLQQEQEFQLGIQLVHPNIAATYGLEEIEGIGRCIVQEWIDGVTLGEWIQTNPPRCARERVFGQLLDALEYLHSLQLVHHDLKTDNILITRNGANVKLIDFGLSAADATQSPVPNDATSDIWALGQLISVILPRQCRLSRYCRDGRYANIAALRRAINRRNRLFRLLPVLLSLVLLMMAAVFFYLSWQERHAEQQRREAMVALIDQHLTFEREQIQELANRPDSFDRNNAADMMAYSRYIGEFTAIRNRQWQIRDSIMNTYDEQDPLREQFFYIWTRKELEIDNELYPQLTGKLRL